MVFEGLDYRTDQPICVSIDKGYIKKISASSANFADKIYIAPGLVDLQINGFNGIDFNSIELKIDDITLLTRILFEKGITTYFPTIITNSDNATEALLKTITLACESKEEIDACIGGIHLEGPFISQEDGPRGAHPIPHIKAPNWKLFSKWQKIAKGRIKIITLSPEWPEAIDFIKRCKEIGVVASIGHTAASPEQINEAVAAGATMSTHLGNASHSLIPRHSNYIFEQLASDNLWSTLIADGFHLPDSLLKIFLRTKPEKSVLVSDATSFANLPSGSYTSHIGGDVVLNAAGRLFMKESPSMLAGSAQSLLWCVNQLVRKNISPLHCAWDMASIKPIESVYGESNNALQEGQIADLVVFKRNDDNLEIIKTIKSGKIVFSKS